MQSSLTTATLLSTVFAARGSVDGQLPQWAGWLGIGINSLLALGTIAAVFVAIRALRYSAEAVNHASSSARCAHLSVLVAESQLLSRDVEGFLQLFSEQNYFLRLFALSQVVEDGTGNVRFAYVRVTSPEHEEGLTLEARTCPVNGCDDRSSWVTSSFEQTLKRRLALLPPTSVSELIGPPWSVTRADMFTFYYFVLRLVSWTNTDEESGFDTARISVLNKALGTQLVLAMAWHRQLAFVLFDEKDDFSSSGFEHSWLYWGLRNDSYSNLYHLLVQDADARGFLTDSHRRQIRRIEDSLRVLRGPGLELFG